MRQADGTIMQEGTIPATRDALDNRMKQLPQPWMGGLEGHFNLDVSASGKVDLVNTGSSVTGFPSWGIYAYPASGGVQTVKEIPENKIEDLQKLPRPIK